MFYIPAKKDVESKSEIKELRAELEKLETAHKALREPKFEIACGRNVAGCYRETLFCLGQANTQAAFYRIGVKAKCVEPIEGCFGRIMLITKDEQPKMDAESITVTFTPGCDDDATAKTITNQGLEYLDVLAICQNNQFLLPTPGFRYPTSLDPQKIFSETGEYLLTVRISGEKTASVRAILKFKWTGEWNNSELELVKTE